jgi:transposase
LEIFGFSLEKRARERMNPLYPRRGKLRSYSEGGNICAAKTQEEKKPTELRRRSVLPASLHIPKCMRDNS